MEWWGAAALMRQDVRSMGAKEWKKQGRGGRQRRSKERRRSKMLRSIWRRGSRNLGALGQRHLHEH
jgi:hypothetical protein